MAIMSGMSATVEIGWKSFNGSNGCFSPSAALVASVVVPSRSVWPSGLDLATTSMPMMVLPPPRFSTMTCWPRSAPNFSATTRPAVSVAPPGMYGTTILICWVGQVWARTAEAPTMVQPALAASTVRRLSMIPPRLQLPAGSQTADRRTTRGGPRVLLCGLQRRLAHLVVGREHRDGEERGERHDGQGHQQRREAGRLHGRAHQRHDERADAEADRQPGAGDSAAHAVVDIFHDHGVGEGDGAEHQQHEGDRGDEQRPVLHLGGEQEQWHMKQHDRNIDRIERETVD